ANNMNRAESGHENQRRGVNSDQYDKRADLTKSVAEQTVMFIGETVADPPARPLNVEGSMPATQMVRLHMQQACARHDKKNDPRQSPLHAQAGVKQFGCAKSEKNRGQKVRRRPN